MFWGALSHLNCLKILVLPMSLGASHSLLLAWAVEICICQLREVLHLQNFKGWHDISLRNDCHTQIASITRTAALISYQKIQQRCTLGNCCYWKTLSEWVRVIILLKSLQCLPSTEQTLDHLQDSWITQLSDRNTWIMICISNTCELWKLCWSLSRIRDLRWRQ